MVTAKPTLHGHALRRFNRISATPIWWLALEKCPNGAEIPFVAQEVGLLLAARPVLDGVAERVHGLCMAADEGPAKVDLREVVLAGLQVRDLADVVAARG